MLIRVNELQLMNVFMLFVLLGCSVIQPVQNICVSALVSEILLFLFSVFICLFVYLLACYKALFGIYEKLYCSSKFYEDSY